VAPATPLPFAFLEAPLSALAVAAGAVSIPVVIHLLNRRRFRVVTWAAMRFLLAAQRKNARRMRLEQLVLLAVRCLAVLLLVAALASVTPWAEAVWHWANPEGGVAVAAGGARRHKILVLDGSFSMGQRPGRRGDGDAAGHETCFDRARALAARLVRESPGGDGFSVVLMAAPPRRVVPEPSEDARKVAAEVEALRLPHGNADLAATLNTVENLLQSSPGKFGDREVYFLTDLQQSTWVARQPAAVAGILQKIQAKARTVFVDVGEDGVNNLAVTGLTTAEDVLTPERTTAVVATLQNFGDQARDVRVTLSVGRARAAAGDPPFELRRVHEQAVRVERGQQVPVAFPYKFPAAGDYVLQARTAEPDALHLDDVRSAVVSVRKDVPVLLVNGKPFGDRFDQAAEWLRLALNPFDRERPPAGVAARPKVINPAQFADEGQGDLTPYDCVFLCDLPSISPAEARRLEAHLRRGGGVVVCLGDQVEAGEYNRVLHRGGAGLLPASLLSRQNATEAFDYQLAFEEGADREPPLKAFQGDNDRAALVNARFRRFYQLGEPTTGAKPRKILSFVPALIPGREGRPGARTAPPGAPAVLAWNPPASAEGSRRGAGEPPVGSAPRLRGRVVLVNTTANAEWGNWPASPSYPAFMQELLNYAAAGRLREREAAVGEPLELFLPNAAGGAEAVVTAPDGRAEATHTQPADDASVLRWADTDLSGVYQAVVGGGPREHLFAVNVPAAGDSQQGSESNLARTGREELQRVYPEWEVQVVRDPKQVVRTAGPAAPAELVTRPQGTVVARGLLLGLLALVLLEIVLAWHFGHYSAAAGEQTAPRPRTWRGRLLYLAPAGLFVVALAAGAVLAHDAWTGDFLGFLPGGARRALEGWMGVPAPAPGEASRWRLEYTPFFWDAHADPWLAAAVLAGGAALVVVLYRREGHNVGRATRAVLVGLRLGLVLLLLAVLLPQLKLWFERQGWPDVVLLIDDSQSMSAVDRYRDPAVKEAADRLAQAEGLAEADRLRLAQALLTRSDPDWLTALLSRRQVRLHVYHCSARAHRLASVTSPGEVGQAVEAVRGLRAEPANDSSQLGAAVRQVLNDFRGSSLAAVVMLTDGVTTEGEDLNKVSRYAAQAGVPLYFVGLGDAHEVRDVAVHDLQVEDSVYVNDRVVFELRLTAQGYGPLTVPVTLREKGNPKALDTQTVKVEPGGKPVKVRLVHQPTEPGEKVYEVEAAAQPDEADRDNNKLERSVFVREAKLIKVLYVEGYRRYEYHYVKTLLERESDRTRGNKSIDLKVLLQDADPDFAAQDRSAIADWSTRAELFTYDVVILGDVDPKAGGDGKTAEHLRDVADFVRERGGGLLVVAGERHCPQAYRNTPLKDVLPVDVTADRPAGDEDVPRLEGYRPELTPVGRVHPIFRFSPDEKENDEIYSRLREMYWYADGYEPKRAAEVLAVHPKRRAARPAAGAGRDDGGAAAGGLDRHPLVVQQFVGAGRSLFLGFDETWRWGFREDQLHFNQFWIQTVRYLARSRVGRIELRLDRQAPYRRGEPIRLTVRFPDDAPPPAADTEVKVVAERRPPGRAGETEVRTVQLARLEGSRATYEALLTRTPEGEYKFWLSQPAAPGPKPRAECRVLAPPGEMERLRMNQPEMERAAAETGGRFHSLADAADVPDELPAGTRVTVSAPGPPWPLWNQAAVFGAALLFLTSEWLLRKQKNLL
jgi:hypothetical protein